jgi:prolipoprotein diacylglyceryltransferase
MLKKGWTVGSGNLLGGYLIGYGFIRFVLEPLRITDWRLGGLFTAQWFGIVAIGAGAIMIKTRRRYEKE